MGNETSKDGLSRDRRGSDRTPRQRREPRESRPDRTRREYQTVPASAGRGAVGRNVKGGAAPVARQVSQQSQSMSRGRQAVQPTVVPAGGGHYGTAQEKKMLEDLRDGYKRAALGYKLNGFQDPALKMFRVAKQLDILIDAINTNKPIDLNGLPPVAPVVPVARRTPKVVNKAPSPPKTRVVPVLQVDRDETLIVEEGVERTLVVTDAAPTRKRPNPEEFTRNSSCNVSSNFSSPPPSHSSSQTFLSPDQSRSPSPTPSTMSRATITSDDVARLFNAPTTASSVTEALQQRMDKYQETFEKAQAEGNASKARRLGRIVKQYENAMKAHKKGQDFDYDSLPTPPGFPPIPMGDHTINQILAEEPKRIKGRAPAPPTALPPSTSSLMGLESSPNMSSYRPKTDLNAKVDDLTNKQKILKQAAVDAKNSGDRESALKYLRLVKGFDPIIEAVKSGLPIDESTIPDIPPEVLIKELTI